MDKLKGEIAIPEAGLGFRIAYKFNDLRGLRDKYGEDWPNLVARAAESALVEVMEQLLYFGIKDTDGNRAEKTFDDIDLPLSEIVKRCLDALYLATFGRTYQDHLEFLFNRLNTMKSGGDEEDEAPLTPKPATTSTE